MNRAQKMHTLKVIRESYKTSLVIMEYISEKDIYLTSNRLEIPESIRELFYQSAILVENVSKQFPTKDWVSIPK